MAFRQLLHQGYQELQERFHEVHLPCQKHKHSSSRATFKSHLGLLSVNYASSVSLFHLDSNFIL